MAYTKYSLTPANNNATPPDGAPEGMLPSAVNDTMRDMMAQIRDVGDGIRDGTYTMTAAKITGGTITGVAFTGNTFTSPVISGGSINNATIGASTANTGAFTTLSATGVATFSAGTVSAPAITTSGDTNTGIFFPAADTIAFTEGGAEAMRIDSSGNVGIGTASPTFGAGSGVELVRTGTATYRATSNGQGVEYRNNAGTAEIDTRGSFPIVLLTNQTERMRIDSSGNVGIGNSIPSTFDSFANRLVVGNGSANQGITIYTGTTNTGSISFADGTSGTALYQGIIQYEHASNGLAFYVNYAGSASPRMFIDSSGNVGIGTSSPAAKLSLTSTGSTTADGIRLTLGSEARSHNIYSNLSTGRDLLIAPYRAITLQAGAGTNEGEVRLQSYESTIISTGSSYTERMRITSAGSLLIGTTSGSARLQVENDNYAVRFVSTNATAGTEVIVQSNLINSNNATSSDYLFIGGINGGADRVYILGNGNLQNINNSYGTLSDVKLKENIVDANPKLDDVMKLQVRNFNLKTDPTQKQIGFVAQELETVFPGLIEEISELDENKNFTGEKVKGIKTTVLIPILVKAIQEQQAQIEELKAEVAALNG